MSTSLIKTTTAAVKAVTPSSLTGPVRTSSGSQQSPQTPRPTLQNPQAPPQPGTWQHPRFEEIARRQNASVFSSENVKRVVWNTVCLILTFIAPAVLSQYTPSPIASLLDPVNQYKAYTLLALRALLLLNIGLACRPLLAAKDEITDIPLTPSQRQLLGLNPSNTPLTPGGQYITPPRFARSTTPRSGDSSRAGSQSPYSGSPLTRDRSPGSFDRSLGQSQRGGSGSPYSGSPLIQKALGGSTSRRLSYDSGSGSSGLPSTPTPVMGTGRASVGLNSKWLYERGRGSPNGRNLFN